MEFIVIKKIFDNFLRFQDDVDTYYQMGRGSMQLRFQLVVNKWLIPRTLSCQSKIKRDTLGKESSEQEVILLCIVCLFIALTWLQKTSNGSDSNEKQKLQSAVIFHQVSEQPMVSWFTPHWVCISQFSQNICPALHQSTQHDLESTHTHVLKKWGRGKHFLCHTVLNYLLQAWDSES